MKEIKKIRIIAVVAFLVAIASLSISYSSLNTTKEVKGIALVEPNVISLKISDIDNLVCDDGSSISEGIILDNTITFNTSLKTVGSNCSFDFVILNNGSYDVTLNGGILDNLNNEHVTYELIGVNKGDSLKIGESKKVSLKVSYNDFVRDEWTEVPVINLNEVQYKFDFEKNI